MSRFSFINIGFIRQEKQMPSLWMEETSTQLAFYLITFTPSSQNNTQKVISEPLLQFNIKRRIQKLPLPPLLLLTLMITIRIS